MTGFNINEFKSRVQDYGEPMPNNRFLVSLSPPRKLVITTPNHHLQFSCNSVTLPGLGILAADTTRHAIGPLERMATTPVFNDSIMQFYVDSENYTRSIFVKWLKLISNNDSRNGLNATNSDGTSPYELNYKDDYVSDITIDVYDRQGQKRVSVTLIDAWPNYVGDIQLDWRDKNNIMLLSVGFTYRDWYETTTV